MARIVADLTLQNRMPPSTRPTSYVRCDYEVVIDPERIDLYSNAAFAQAFKVVPCADDETINACFHEVEAVIMPLYGSLNVSGN